MVIKRSFGSRCCRLLVPAVLVLTLCVRTPSDVEAFSPQNPDAGIGKPPKPFNSAFAVDSDVSGRSSAASARNGGTARESTILEEWEMMSELERRIEDGANYEHMPEGFKRTYGKRVQTREWLDDCDEVQGVFCGYRTTADDYVRLKSAHP